MEKLFKVHPYSLSKKEKDRLLVPFLIEIFNTHYLQCREVRNIFDSLGYESAMVSDLSDLPYFPVRIFKELELKSIDRQQVIKTLTSSGTTGQKTSKIYLDSETSILQTKALASIISSFIGPKRLPMIIVDTKNVLKDRSMFSARGAGILGISNFGRNHLYSLDEQMNLDIDSLVKFITHFNNQPVLIFGFTFMIWIHFVNTLIQENIKLNIPKGILIHSGGWKKLESLAVNNETFRKCLKEQANISKVYNFYGMVEQTGSIYMECENGYYHTSNYSEIIIRDKNNFRALEFGNPGIIQTISILPKSYPGNSILTEDEGVILGVDDCSCGRKGTYFKVLGRLKQAELRGCSDTYAENIMRK